jgi:vacuolar-type H+-ATPase subunit H
MWGWIPQYGQTVFFWSTLVAAVFGGVGIGAAFVSAMVGYELSEWASNDATERIAKAESSAKTDIANARSEADAKIGVAREESKVAVERALADSKKSLADAASANARALEAQLALEKFKAPRWISDEQQKLLVSRLSRFQGVLVDVWLLHAPSQDAAPFAQRLLSVLATSQWKANGVFNLMGGATATGVIIVMRENPSPNDKDAAVTLLNELKSAGIAADLQKGVTDSPVETLGAFVGPNASNPPSNLWVAIGSKP